MAIKKVKKAVLSGVKACASHRPVQVKLLRLREIECQIKAHADNIVYVQSRAMGRKDSRRIVGKESLFALQSRLADEKRLPQTLANLRGQMDCLAKEREVLLNGG